MYGYEWTDEYGIFRLTIDAKIQKEIRPVFYEELDFFGMDQYWDYPKNTDAPILWAEGVRRYVLNGVPVAEVQGGGFYTKPIIKRLTEDRLQLQTIDIHRLYEENKRLMVSLEQKAIRFIQDQHEKYSKQGFAFVCAFSGGKDSLVLLDLVAKALAPDDFYVVFSNTGMELSDTYKAVERAKNRWPQLRFEEAKCHMDATESWAEFGPPASRLRWCCAVHKSVPTILLIQKLTGKNSKAVVFDGVRAEESLRRAKYYEVGEGVKNFLQINCHAILRWSSAEVFVHMFQNDLLLNHAYRHGIYRVGCKVCPMSSRWQDALIAAVYPEEIQPALSLLESITIYAKGRLDKQYIEDGGWQARAGGRILQQGENRVNEHVDNDRMVFTIANARQKWMDVSPIIGTVVESNANHYLVKTKQGLINMICKESGNEQTITISPISILDRYTISSLRSVANKVAYCVGCKACMPQCPTGAFQIIEGKITIRENACIHCSNCCTYTDRGCLVAKSLYVRSNSMKNPDRYRNFGFRRAFYEHFLEKGVVCFDKGTLPPNERVLGEDQYKGLKQWLADAGMLKVEVKETSGRVNERVLKELTPLAEKLIPMGSYNPFPWAIMWANLAYNSIVCNFFCLHVNAGEIYDKDYLVDSMPVDIDKKYRGQAVNSLLSTFRDSPIGSSIKQGIQIENSYLREGWEYPHAVALLYSLYLYAEKTGRRTFTFTELANAHNNPDAKGMSPHDIYGIDLKAFREQVQGLALNYPEYIRVSFVANLDNIMLEDYSSNDILDLAKDD